MSSFINGTYNALGIHRSRTSSYHPAPNGTTSIGIGHFTTDCRTILILQFELGFGFTVFLMAYRATPHSTTGYSPFFLLHGWEIILPSNENVRAKVPKPNSSYNQQIERLKSGLKQAYESVSKASGKSHQANVVMIVEQRIATLRHETMCTCTSLQEGKVYPKNSIVPGRGRLKLQPKYI